MTQRDILEALTVRTREFLDAVDGEGATEHEFDQLLAIVRRAEDHLAPGA
jgi:hypothetical protein